MRRVEISYSSAPKMSRVKVVYYLSHGGRLEQPHLIEVERQNNSSIGLSLSDVKKRLTAVRGKGMPDAFSWAYKRSFKNDFIWNDVTENDVILPFREDEYIIKGSENVYGNHDHYYRRIEDGLFGSPLAHQRNAHLRATPTDGSPSPLASVATPKSRHSLSIGGALRVNRKLMDSLTQAKTESTTDEAFADPNSDASSNGNFSSIKVYKTHSSPITIDHGMDAATQTEDHFQPGNFHHVQDLQSTSSPVCRKADRVLPALRKQPEEPNGKRQQAGAMVFRHMLACGGVDTITSPSKVPFRVQNWSSWTKPRPDADASTKFPSCKSPDRHAEVREQQFHGQQDPESMPEVVKETTCLASEPSTRMTMNSMEKRSPLCDRPKDLRGQTSVRFAVKEVRRVEESSPRSSTASRVLKTSDLELLSPAIRCEEGSLTKRELCRDDRPLTPGRSRLDWERTLLEAVNSSAPPVDFRQILQECQQCGRTFKPDSLKVHLRGCHGQRSGKSTALMTSEAKRFS